ncbi:MAG: ABC transporter permease [Candidatus Solibacter sp.]
MSYRRIRAIFVKELHHITRDARSLALALALPLLMLLLFGYALSLDVDRIPTMIYDQDHSAQSRDLIREFQGSRFFEIRGMADNYAAIEYGIDRSRVLVGVVIPVSFGRELAAGPRKRAIR